MTRNFAALAVGLFLAAGAALAQPIPHRYIVVYKDNVADPAAESDRMVREAGGRRHHAFTKAIKGFAATLSDEAVQKLRGDPDVAYIEQDQIITASGVENSATWGLDRIDQADRPLDTQYHYNYTGSGVYAFVIDTGIRADHVEFGGRVLSGHTEVNDGNGTNDCAGHGTHVAGTIGGATWGVAKQVSFVPVRVLDCSGSGTTSGVIAGVDWVAASNLRPAVANMSLGGGLSTALNAAVARATAAGVTMVVAAGNENTNACNKSPASEPTAITVGATTNGDARASFSNFGKCVDVFAPGVNITSAWYTGSTDTNTISGTSMATPHVTGVAALALSANPSASPLAVSNFIQANATAGRLSTLGTGSPNLLVYSLAAGAPTEPPLPTIAVKTLTGAKTTARGGWAARATITVRNVNTNAVIAGAVVSGAFAPGGSGQCTTSTTGSCSITSAMIPNATPSTVFTVSDVSKTAANYDSSQNSASQVTVSSGVRRR
jgi:subtilisin family serine protease